jgi:predicted lipid-binding transport protein (Tim44 family)
MLDEGNTPTDLETPDAPPPEESNNRTFLIVGGIFAALIFLTLACIAVYVLWLGPRLASQKTAAQSTIEAKNAQVAMEMTATADAALWTPTPLPSFTPTKTPIPTVKPIDSPTPVLAVSTVAVPATSTPTSDPATLAAMQTQLAQQMTSTAVAAIGGTLIGGTPAAAMPKTGFFDQVGLPTLAVLTLVLLAVIFLARRMRRLPTK